MQDFDGQMSGSLYLTHANLDLDLVCRVGQEIVTYGSIDECIEKAKWYIAHDDEREQIATAGRARAVVDHTWDKRFADLLASVRTVNCKIDLINYVS
jgi:spore maturation protein CgeB